MNYNVWTVSSPSEEVVGVVVSLLNLLVFCVIYVCCTDLRIASVPCLGWCAQFGLGSIMAGSAIVRIIGAGTATPCLLTILVTWLVMATLVLVHSTSLMRKKKVQLDEKIEPLLGSSEGTKPAGQESAKACWSSSREVPDVLDFDKESAWSVWSFQWMNSFLSLGARKPLAGSDCPRLGPRDQCQAQFERFWANWESHGQKYPHKKQSLLWVLWDTFWQQIVVNAFLAFVFLVCLYTGPVMLGILVTFVGKEERTALEGIGLVSILYLAKLVQGMAERRWYFGVERLGLWINSALVSMTYRKGLRLSNSGRSSHGAGEIVNYLAVDVQAIQDFMWWMQDTWLLPAMTIAALVILFATVGLGALAGVAIIFVCMACQVPLAHYTEKLQSKVMAAKDARMKATTEYLKGMRVIKLWAWEEFFHRKLLSLRATEFRYLCYNAGLKTVNIFLIYLCPLLVALVTLGACVLLGEPLTSAKVFTAIATFRIIQDPLFLLPLLIAQIAEASVSLTRLQKLFHSEELQDDAVQKNEFTGANKVGKHLVILVHHGSFRWDTAERDEHEDTMKDKQRLLLDEGEGEVSKLDGKGKESDEGRVTLRDIHMEVAQGERWAVCGSVGCGKSSLLLAVLGEMSKLSGQVSVNGSVAYVPQSPWIQSGTIEDNILFGQPMDRKKYEEAIRVCSLQTDIRALPDGDQTEIGERGINMSGGQKQRIQLARAVYQDADMYLLDDPFSAVDAHTGTEIFTECVMGALLGKTVLLVTHQVEFLPAVDVILVMRDGQIVQRGRYEDLLDAGTDFGLLVSAHNEAMNAVGNAQSTAEGLPQTLDALDNYAPELNEIALERESTPFLTRGGSSGKEVVPPSCGERDDKGKQRPLVQAEESEVGRVGIAVYLAYLRGFWGGALIPFIALALVLYQVTQIAGNYWLSYATTPDNAVDPRTMVQIYGWLTSGGVLFVLIRSAAVNLGGVLTAQKFFVDMLKSIFWSPMSFFDTTPTGRILARASSDQSHLDMEISQSFAGAARNFMDLLATLFVTATITPPMLFASIPCTILVFLLQRYYLKSSRELTRVVSKAQAPILNHFSESVAGAPIIRAFRKDEEFLAGHMRLVNLRNGPGFFNAGASHWFMLRLETLAVSVFATSATLLVLLPTTIISPALAGLCLAYGLTLNESICYWAWWATQLENKIISVERIRQYTNLPQEAPAVIPDRRPPSRWPHAGTVELRHLEVRYHEDSPLVLDDVSCTIRGGEKVGVVGRTGSGKSTLIQALFRIVEPAGGAIVIDGVDVMSMGLKDLRTHLSIIPQEPTLFQGSVRSNMDPQGEFTDSQVWEALDRCQLGDVVRGSQGQLDASVSDGGENWSVGQRQLFCLGRALLKQSRILVLDEATASVDAATDGLIQKTLAAHFSSCTVISVAHRIPTVIDSDKVLVLQQGKVAEYDSPQVLLQKKDSLFSKLVAEYSKRSNSMADLASLARVKSTQNLQSS